MAATCHPSSAQGSLPLTSQSTTGSSHRLKPTTMAPIHSKPVSTHRMQTRSKTASTKTVRSVRTVSTNTVSVNTDRQVSNAFLINALITSRVRRDNERLLLENQLLMERVANYNTMMQRIDSLTGDQMFMDQHMREIFMNHPDVCWEYRNRLTYDDIEPVDPEATEEEGEATYRRMFGLDEDSEDDEDIQELYHEMRRDQGLE